MDDEPAKTLPVNHTPLAAQEIPASLLSFVMKIGEKNSWSR
ncbi:hypothetical protein OL548_08575 [Lysinibacillus sp. MHQ-1]|nr:hypothetical protein OL548_08575 [Lysinibacillus sp. MHQ-1]